MTTNVLILCTHNSARSVLAEAMLHHHAARLGVDVRAHSAAREACPVWPGDPVRMHWGYPDPSNTPGDEAARLRAFDLTREAIGHRMLELLRLPLGQMDGASLAAALRQIA